MPGLTYNPPIESPILVDTEFNNIGSLDQPTVSISINLSEQLSIKLSDEIEHYISIKLIDSIDSNEFHIYKVSKSFTIGLNKIIINDSRFNNINITIDKALITKIIPVELTKVIISLNSQAYNLLQKTDGLTLLNILQKKFKLELIHQDDLIDTLGKILSCEPIDQGFLTFNTIITLVKDDSLLHNSIIPKHEVIDLSSYSSHSSNQKIELKVEPLLSQVEDYDGLNHDNENIFMTNISTLAQIGCLSGDFINVELDGVVKLVKIQSFYEPNSFNSNTLYISPIWLLNNNSPDTIIVQKTSQTLQSLPIANKIIISRNLSPFALSKTYQQSYLMNLKNYFESKSRIISLNDLIPISFDSILCESNPLNNPEFSFPLGNPNSIQWFKIEEIDDGHDDTISQYIMDPTFTSLTQTGVFASNPPSSSDYDWLGYLKLSKPFDYGVGFPYVDKINNLIKSSMINKSLQTSVLISSLNRKVGKSFIVENLCKNLGIHLFVIDAIDVYNPISDAKTLGTIKAKLDKPVELSSSSSSSPSNIVILIKHVEILTFKTENSPSGTLTNKFLELLQGYIKHNGVCIFATSNDTDSLPEEIRSFFKFEIDIPIPSEFQRDLILNHLIQIDPQIKLSKTVSISSLSLKSAGLSPWDLSTIVQNTKLSTILQLEDLATKQNIHISNIINNNPILLTPKQFESCINEARNKLSDSIGAPKIPNVTWDDVGGLDLIKGEILDTIDMPLKHPELFTNGVKKRSGILFYGPPGTGKTLLAKAIATNFSLNFFSVKGPELLNMYIGESESNVRKVFQKARDSKPCVVFFDELDSVAPKRGNQGDSGGVMDRIVSQILAELDGMSDGEGNGDGVFVVGATNRPDLLDEALLRPGRFDKLLYLGISDTNEKQTKILQALTRKFNLDPSVELNKIAEACPFNFTGADFYALCSDAMLNAMTRVAKQVDTKLEEYNKGKEDPVSTRWWFDNIAQDEDVQVLVSMDDFIKASNELKPSVSFEELQHYLKVRENFES